MPAPSPVIQLASGSVSGIDGPVRAYLGIPYAAPPIGTARWQPPRPPAPWRGVREAVRFGDDFPQAPNPLFRAHAQSEDCLYLNVWAPAHAAPGSLPVMVWFHGGGFVGGSGSDVRCDGHAFAAGGAVVVSFNYRSGIFGFLAHPSLTAESAHASSGNYGLLDQIAALAWVRENIAAFGGSPKRVTVFGVSAGSASISLLLTSPLAKGLFQRAILHSPGACRPLASLADAERAGRSVDVDIAALRGLDATQLLAKTSLLVPKMRGLTTPRVLRPIRDGWVVPRDEREAFDDGAFEPMSIVVGTNEDEGSKLTAGWTIDTPAQYRDLIDDAFGPLAERALACYPADDATQVRRRVAEVFGDAQFNYGAWRLAKAMSRSGQRTWRYVFRRRRPGQPDGPHHGDEVAYTFDTLSLQYPGASPADAPASVDEVDHRVSRTMHGAWLRFASTGDPNGGDLAPWPEFAAEDAWHLAFDDTTAAGRHWRAAQIAFFDDFHRQDAARSRDGAAAPAASGPPPAQPLRLPAALRARVDGALANRCPMVLAYTADDGQPILSFRGSVQVYDDDALAMWIRKPDGRMMASIAVRPRVTLMYRDEATRATYQFQGRARRVDDPDVRERVWSSAPEVERAHDPSRTGAAVVVVLDRVEGYAGVGPSGQIDKLLLRRHP
ncbi:MAG: carboxylesterase family protein [Lautropia sp.]